MAGYSTPAWSNGQSPAVNAANLLALGEAVELGEHPYGVCSTAAATAAKAVTIDFTGTLALFTGLSVRVKFSNGNSAANPTLNVNGTGDVPMMATGTVKMSAWLAGQTMAFTYDGASWMLTGLDAWTRGETLSDATAAQLDALTGTLPTTPDAALALLTTYAAGGAKCAYGSYTGTGTFGSANPNTLSLGFNAILVLVYRAEFGLEPSSSGYWTNDIVWLQGMARVFVTVPNVGYGYAEVSQSAGVFSWYSIYDAARQLNISGVTYHYVAIGV